MHRGQKSSFFTSKGRGKPSPGSVFLEHHPNKVPCTFPEGPVPSSELLLEPGRCWNAPASAHVASSPATHRPSQPFQAPLHVPRKPQAVVGHSCQSHPPRLAGNTGLWDHLWFNTGLASPRLGLWDCPCGFEGLGRGAAWLGSCRRVPGTVTCVSKQGPFAGWGGRTQELQAQSWRPQEQCNTSYNLSCLQIPPFPLSC